MRARSTRIALRLAAVRTPLPRSTRWWAARERELATPGPATDAFVEQVAARTGRSAAQIHALLFGDPPDDDEALAVAVEDLDHIVNAVRRERPRNLEEAHRDRDSPDARFGGVERRR